MTPRALLAIFAAALAAAPLGAQKPEADDAPDPARETYRGQGISMCVAELRAADGLTADDKEAICGCTLERLMERRPTEALPPLAPDRLRAVIGGRILGCTIETVPARASAVARWLTAAAPPGAPAPAAAPSPSLPDKPTAEDDTSAARASPGIDPSAWLDGLGAFSWLTGGRLPRWAWIPLAAFAFALLWLFLRRRDGDRDLDGPPPHIGSRFGPPPRR